MLTGRRMRLEPAESAPSVGALCVVAPGASENAGILARLRRRSRCSVKLGEHFLLSDTRPVGDHMRVKAYTRGGGGRHFLVCRSARRRVYAAMKAMAVLSLSGLVLASGPTLDSGDSRSTARMAELQQVFLLMACAESTSECISTCADAHLIGTDAYEDCIASCFGEEVGELVAMFQNRAGAQGDGMDPALVAEAVGAAWIIDAIHNPAGAKDADHEAAALVTVDLLFDFVESEAWQIDVALREAFMERWSVVVLHQITADSAQRFPGVRSAALERLLRLQENGDMDNMSSFCRLGFVSAASCLALEEGEYDAVSALLAPVVTDQELQLATSVLQPTVRAE